jgi:aspartate/glutamate racemase
MTKLLEEVFEKVSQLPDKEQDAVASLVLEELSSEQQWDESFERSQDVLAGLASEAINEFDQGKTKEFP